MGFWSEIADSLKQDEVLAGLEAAQCEAVIDALLLIIYADDEASFLELNELEHLLHELPWALKNAAEVDAYTEASAAKISAIKGDDAREAFAASLAARLGEMEVRKRTFKMAASLAYANWDASKQEHLVLMILARGLEIPAPFAQAMVEDVSHESAPPEGLDEPTNPSPLTSTVREVLSKDFLQDFFSGLFADDDLKHLDEEAALAFVDALSISLVADGYPESEELQEFKMQLEQLPFSQEDIASVQARVEITINSMRHSASQDQLAFVKNISAKIPSTKLREQALRMAIAISNADFAITDAESKMLRLIADGLGVEAARLQTLITEVRASQDHGLFE